MRHHPRPVALAAIATALMIGLGLAGCGSSSSSSSSSSGSTQAATATLTRTEFLAKGNVICRAQTAEQAKDGKALGAHPGQAQIVKVIRTKMIPSIQTTIDQVRALAAHTNDQAKISEFLNVGQADLNKVKADPRLLLGAGSFANFAALAHPYGLKACAPSS